MNRRGFLSFLTAAAVAPLVPVPELDLGRRIFLPPRGGWIGNSLLTPQIIAAEALRVITENMRFISQYDFERDQIVGRHDVLIGDEQFGVDHVLGPNFGEREAKAQAATLLNDVIQHRGLSTINIKRPPRFA